MTSIDDLNQVRNNEHHFRREREKNDQLKE